MPAFLFPTRLWLRLREQLWFKPAWWGVLASVLALAAKLANQVVPDGSVPDIAQDTLQSLLTIIASSMLTVSTFSLSILVQAFSSAAGSATPRALRVIMADNNAQTAIATFIAAFIYAVIALMALGLGYYGATGRFMLLLLTIAVVLQVIVMLIRWIRTLSRLGRLGHTVAQVEAAACEALRDHWRAPTLGAQPAAVNAPLPGGRVVHAPATGYVQHLDVPALQRLAESCDARLWLCVRPGAFVVRGECIAVASRSGGGPAELDATQLESLRSAIEIGADRNFAQDPRFGLLVLSEIGQRALSAAVNDAGSAILVGNAITRVIVDTWLDAREERVQHDARGAPARTANCDRVFVPLLDEAELVRDAFMPLQRDAGALVEVHTRLTKLLDATANATGGALAQEARRLAWRGWLLARDKIVLNDERDELERLARSAAGLSS